MYCINFRRSTFAIDYDQKGNKNRRRSEFYRNLDRKPQVMIQDPDAWNTRGDLSMEHKLNHYDFVGKSSTSNTSLKTHVIPNNQERSNRSFGTKNKSITSEMRTLFEKKPQQEEFERSPPGFVVGKFSGRKPCSTKLKTSGFGENLQQVHRDWVTCHQNREPMEEKKEEISTFSISRMNELDLLMSQIPFRGDNTNLSPSPVVRKMVSNHLLVSDETSSFPPLSSSASASVSVSSFEQRLRNELQKSCRMLDMERNQNLALKHKLEDRSKSNNVLLEEYALQIRTLRGEVTYYREEYDEERKKRKEVEEKLEEARQENQTYADKLDVLMFQHVPSVAPKFKDIGPVDYNINESSNSVGSYRLGELLGEGYYGSVRMGFHKENQQNYAIKLLNKDNITLFTQLQQIAIEVHVLKMYRHPNIVRLEEVIHAENNIYVVTELCCMDLHKYHNEIGLTIDSAREVVLGILRPLHHLHSHGICHLDLKPENVILTKSFDSHNAKCEHVRLCDFGLVNMAREPEKSKDIIRTGYACGTPGFYCPEMVIHDRFEGRSADMWSLGCIILEITFGFTQEWIDSYDQADDNPAAFQNRLESSLSEINAEQYPNQERLLSMIHSCLSIDSSKRIASADALKHDWIENNSFPKRSGNIFQDIHQREHMGKTFSRMYSERLLLLDTQVGFCA